MAPILESGSGPSKRNGTSISDLVLELRDSFLSSDFDRVEEMLVAREAMLEAELEEKKKEIGSLRERIAIERLGRIDAELKLKRLRGKKLVKSDNGFGLDCEIVVKREKCEFEGGDGVEGGKIEALGEMERRVVDLESEKERKVCEEKKEVVGINGSVLLKRYGGGLGASGGKPGIEDVIFIDSDEDKCNSEATWIEKETTSCTIIDNDNQSSPAAFQKNLPIGLTESIGNLKRKFISSPKLDANINVLEGLDSEDSPSSTNSGSSSSPFDMDSLPVTNNKKTRADATSLRLNLLRR